MPWASRIRFFTLNIFPIILWAFLIFVGSTDVLSSDNTSHFIFPILQFLFPTFSTEELNQIHHWIRKCGHITEYGILSFLIWRAVHGFLVLKRIHRSYLFEAIPSLFLSILYAASDEYHQTFYASRTASVKDILYDSTGAFIALFLIYLVHRLPQKS